MRNLRLEIEYDGTNYCGWQVQNTQKSGAFSRKKKAIQEVLEKALRKILQERITLIASGRTDAGVHARAQIANFKTNSKITLEKLQKALNGLLPEDIVITAAEEAAPEFHSRFCAKSKVYRYTILNRPWPSALLKDKVYFYPYHLDMNLMRRQARHLLGRHDFRAFCASGSDVRDTVRTIKKITIKKIPSELSAASDEQAGRSCIIIDIEADGFLYNMVRNIVGTLIEIGRGKFPANSLSEIMRSKNRSLAGPAVPACGLCLLQVKY